MFGTLSPSPPALDYRNSMHSIPGKIHAKIKMKILIVRSQTNQRQASLRTCGPAQHSHSSPYHKAPPPGGGTSDSLPSASLLYITVLAMRSHGPCAPLASWSKAPLLSPRSFISRSFLLMVWLSQKPFRMCLASLPHIYNKTFSSAIPRSDHALIFMNLKPKPSTGTYEPHPST